MYRLSLIDVRPIFRRVENSRLQTVGQFEDIERVSTGRRINLRAEQTRGRAKKTRAGWNREVLLAADGVRDGKAVDCRAESELPQQLARFGVERFHVSIRVADEHEAAGRRQRCRVEHRALLVRPELLHRPYVECAQLAEIAVASRHLEEPHVRPGPATTLPQFDLPAFDLETALM